MIGSKVASFTTSYFPGLIQNVKTDPQFTTDLHLIPPPRAKQSFLEMFSPRPVPCLFQWALSCQKPNS